MPTVDFDDELPKLKTRIRDNDDISQRDKDLILKFARDVELEGLTKARVYKLATQSRG